MARLIFHVDVNSAFLSWEAARRVSNGEPDIRLIPSVIGGDREKRTGVVLAKSIPAKKLGIRTGEPIGMALRKCPDLFMAKPDFRLYEENSKKFMDVCREYAPIVEKASIDECYLDLSGTHRIYPDPIALAHTIKDRIRDEFKFTVNIGIGENKLLAIYDLLPAFHIKNYDGIIVIENQAFYLISVHQKDCNGNFSG